jgi:hypothetical protein
MIMFRINLDDDPAKDVEAIVERMVKSDEEEIEALMAKQPLPTARQIERLAELRRRQKFLTKNNLMIIFALRGIEDMSASDKEDYEETVDLMVEHGYAKGRPDAD